MRIAILQGNKIKPLLRMGPLRRGNCAAAFVPATTRAVDNKLSGVWSLRSMAVMNGLVETAGMQRRSGNRQSYRREVPHQREHQQKLGDDLTHTHSAQSLPTYRCRKQ